MELIINIFFKKSFIESDGYIKLADFGLSKENVKDHETALSLCGSPAYLPPEIVNKQGFLLGIFENNWFKGSGKAADIYAIGTVLFEMITGMPPFYSDDIHSLYANIKEGDLKFDKPVSPEAEDLIRVFLWN